MDYKKRIEKLQKKLKRRNIDALLVSQQHNRRYLSGYTAVDHDISESSGVLLIPASGKGFLLTDFRYQLQAEQEVSHLDIKIYRRGLIPFLKKFLVKQNIRTFGFESHYTLYSTSQEYIKELGKKGIELKPLPPLIEPMRVIKDTQEIQAIRESVKLNEEVFQEVYPQINKNCTELEIAILIEQTMRTRGAESTSFDSIVAAGANSALPHAVPTVKKIVKNGPLTIDMGLVLNGYCSDMTRSFTVGKADKKYKKIHRIVRRAQLAGMEAVKAGVTGKEVDRAARQIIEDEGYGQYFGHSLGHGVGLAVHEAPRVAVSGVAKLKKGMIITIEPGIYIPGWGGVRLENMVVVRKNGCENLNSDTTWLDI